MTVLVVGVLVWVGGTLLLGELPWFARRGLVARVAPYVPAGRRRVEGLLSVASFRELLGPLAELIASRVVRLFGVREAVAVRLRRIHSPHDATAFRVRQLGWAVAASGCGAVTVALVRPPPVAGLVLVAVPGVLAVLVLEQQIVAASKCWQQDVRSELPVVAEHLGTLLGAGYSLVGALTRIADRGHGAVARDLIRVLGRVEQGTDVHRALAEWAALAEVDGVDQLVRVLALHRHASDLGRLIAGEAQVIRGEVHRALVATMEQRGQQVWIPVTVATLVPGVILIGVPFLAALEGFLG